MKKKLWIFLLALALCVGALYAGSRVDAADETQQESSVAKVEYFDGAEIRYFDTVEDAFAWIKGTVGTVTLLKDVEISAPLQITAGANVWDGTVLDLGGKTLSANIPENENLADSAVVYINPASTNHFTIQNGTIKNLSSGIGIYAADGLTALKNLTVTSDIVIPRKRLEYGHNMPELFSGSFSMIRPDTEYSFSLSLLLSKGSYAMKDEGRLDKDAKYTSLENIKILPCDHKNIKGEYTFVEIKTQYGARAMLCETCDNLCPHEKINPDGTNTCTVCGLPILIKTTNVLSEKPVGPWYYTGLDNAMYEILNVNKGSRPTLQLLADTESDCKCAWYTNDYDGIFIDLAGHTLTLIGDNNKASYWVTFQNTSDKPAKVVGTVNVCYNSPSLEKQKLFIPNENNNLTIQTVKIGAYGAASLAGGGFGSISISADSRAKTLADLLAPGYCYYVGGDYEKREGGTATLGEGLTELTNVYVAPCDHSGTAAFYHSVTDPATGTEYDAWTCPCGEVIFATRSQDAQGTVMYYPAEKFADAFANAAPGTTVALLPLNSGFPTGDITIDKDLTIDIGEIGFFANELHFDIADGAKVTMIGGSADAQRSPAQFVPSITVKSGGRLTVPAEYAAGQENRISISDVYNGGICITVESGGTAEFYSSSARGISVSGTVTVAGGIEFSGVTVNAGGELTVTGGEVSSTTINGGELIVSGGEVQSSTIESGSVTVNNGGTLSKVVTINGGSVTVTSGFIPNSAQVNGGTLTVEDGYLNILNVYDGAEAFIKGGTVGGNVCIYDGGKLTVTGGDLTKTTDIKTGGEAEFRGGAFDDVSVSGKLTLAGAQFKNGRSDLAPGREIGLTVYSGGEMNFLSGSVDHLYVSSGGTLTVSGGKTNKLETAYGAWEKVTLSGGEFGEIALREYKDEALESVRDVTYADFAAMLDGGKAYQKSGSTTYAGNVDVVKDDYYDVLGHIKLLRGVTVTAAPFTGLAVSNASVTYGSSAALTADIPNAPAGVTYQWYLDGAEIPNATGATYNTADTLDAGTYTYTVEAIYNGYVCRSSEVTVTVEPRKIYPIPAAIPSKVYDGTSNAAVVLSGFSYTDGGAVDIALELDTDYTIPTAYYYTESAKPTSSTDARFVCYRINLLNQNYTFDQNGQEPGSGLFWISHASITQGTIDQAPITSAKRLTILNRHQKTYEIDLTQYLPTLTANCDFGDVTYSDLQISLMGYYTYRPPQEAKIENGKLTLPIVYKDTEETDAGQIQLTVSSTNYKDFTLIIQVDASNKALPTGTVTPSRTTLTYGEKLSDITLSSGMTCEGAPVEGTLRWVNPDMVPEIGEYDAKWIFEPDEDETYLPVTGTVKITVNPITYSVSVAGAEHGSVTSSRRSAAQGQTVTITVTPEEGYVLDTLTVTDARGNAIALTVKDGGRYTFKMPARRVTVTAAFKAAAADFPFTDVKEGGFYYDAVHWAWENSITDGWGRADTFAPGQDCTRAQIVTFLWRAAGCPVVNYFMPFTDVDEGAWYAEAVRWAASEGITAGYGRTDLFAPDQPCTRAQAVTFLFRALEGEAGESSFSDVPAGAFYADAVGWAWENGITKGIGGGKFGPGLTCQRAQIVTLLYRALVK